MTLDRKNLDPVEALLDDLEQAERAGVFRPSSLNPTSLLRSTSMPAPVWITWLKRPRVAWSLAAALALAATVWTWMIRTELRSIGERRDEWALATREMNRNATAPSAHATSPFSTDCMTGPADEADDPCQESDLVADRHIDLRDFGLLQRTLQRR